VTIVKIDTSCPLALAAGGFVAQALGPGAVVVSSDFVATPDQLVDGVIGLSTNPATGFNDLAATVRFSPNGIIEARNGDHFQADVLQPYFAGASRRIRIIANVSTHTFSVYVAPDDHHSVQLANRYAFRTTQSAASSLGALNAIIDSPQGITSICDARSASSLHIKLSREGNHAVAPLPASHEALIASAALTLRVSVALSATGAHLFTNDIHQSEVRSIASNGSSTAISALAGPLAPRLIALDQLGNEIGGQEVRSVFSGSGDAGSVAVAPSGRIYWNFSEAWPSADAPAYPYLVSLQPGG